MAYITSRKHGLAHHTSPGSSLASGAKAATFLTGLALTLPLHAQQAGGEATLPAVTVQGEGNAVKADAASSGKFTAPLVDTPKTVTVITQEVMQQTAVTNLSDALRTTPGITFGSGEGGNPMGDRPFLRGSDAQNSIFVDGLRDIAAGSREIFNLESVEVVKGSDSAYVGRAGAGGSINLNTKAPRNENFVAGSLGLGSDSYKRATVDGNWHNGHGIAARLNVMAHDADVPGRSGPDNTRWGFAPSVTLGMDGPTRVTFQYFHLQSSDTPDGGLPYDLPASLPTTGERVIRPTDGGNRNHWYGQTGRDFRKERTDTGTVTAEHDLDADTRLRNTLRYSHSRQDYVWTQPDDSHGNVAGGNVWRRYNSRYSTVETLANQSEATGEVSGWGLRHRYAVGLELAREKVSNDSYALAPGAYATEYARVNGIRNGAGCSGALYGVCTSLFSPADDPWLGSLARNHNPAEFTSNTASLYGFDTVDLAPGWLLNLGLRVDKYRTKQLTSIATTGATAGTRTRYDRDDTLLNYQLGLVYKLAPNGSVYASIGSASTPGNSSLGQGQEGLSIASAVQEMLKPEKTRSYELGTKWDVLDRQLALTAALFRNETTNARITDADGVVSMAGTKQVDGLELGFSGRITRAWDVFGGYTYMDSEQKNIGDVALSTAGVNAVRAGQPAAGTGMAFPNTPRHSYSLWTSYRFTPKFTAGLGVVGQSDVIANYAYNGNALIKRGVGGYTRFDAMASYAYSRQLTLQLNVNNLFDKQYYASTYSTHYATPANGRSAIVAANFKF